MRRLGPAITGKQIPQPTRTIRLVLQPRRAAQHQSGAVCRESKGNTFKVVRGPWSTADVTDEVVEVFSHQAVRAVETRSYEDVGQPQWDVAVTAIVPPADPTDLDRASFIAAASAYFLATLPTPAPKRCCRT